MKSVISSPCQDAKVLVHFARVSDRKNTMTKHCDIPGVGEKRLAYTYQPLYFESVCFSNMEWSR